MNNIEERNATVEKGKLAFYKSLLYPLIFVFIVWTIKIVEIIFGISFSTLGVFPQTLEGLRGIIFSPLIHGDLSHLISNSIPILVLGSMLYYFYKQVAFKVFFLGWFMMGIWLWIIGRDSYHIGASGLIYCMASFLFVSGIIRKHKRLMAVSLIVIFLYGSIIWGIFPLAEKMSWEGHLSGLAAGIVLAIFYRKQGPQRKLYTWEIEEEEEYGEESNMQHKEFDEPWRNIDY
ncbi:MAG: rhomboid family intramembrane serine protease [Bacteroidota bacterium]